MRKSQITAFAVFIIMMCTFSLSGCTQTLEKSDVTGYKLNTYVAFTAYAPAKDNAGTKEILNSCLSLCDKYEAIFSRTLETSELSKVNSGKLTTVSRELGELIEKGLYYSKLSDGAFDVAIGSVSSLWDFNSENPTVPDSSSIANALKYVDYTKVYLTKNADETYNISMPTGTMLDLGAIAKGYIADRIKDFMVDSGITHGIINLGGNVLCVGGKDNNTSFTIGIKKPFSESENSDVLKLNDISCVTSGTYERYFNIGDKFYHHILNPATGYSYDNGLTSVSIISKDSVSGDCLSTTCFALGLDKGMELIETLDNTEAMFITSDGIMHYSSGWKGYE